jgi:hypothetical protein
MKFDDVHGAMPAFAIRRAKQAKDRLSHYRSPQMSLLGELRDQFWQAF